MSAADVDDTLERSEVIRFGNGFVGALAQGDHGALKQGGVLWVFRQPVEPCESSYAARLIADLRKHPPISQG